MSLVTGTPNESRGPDSKHVLEGGRYPGTPSVRNCARHYDVTPHYLPLDRYEILPAELGPFTQGRNESCAPLQGLHKPNSPLLLEKFFLIARPAVLVLCCHFLHSLQLERVDTRDPHVPFG